MTRHQKNLTLNGEEDTVRIAAQIGSTIRDGAIVALQGDLGAGKTVMARSIARSLGIKERVTSPTFGLVMEYERPDKRWLYHLDMYRIENSDQASAFGVEEYLGAVDAVVIVEWPERIAEIMENEAEKGFLQLLHIKIQHAGGDRRTLVLPTTLYEKICENDA